MRFLPHQLRHATELGTQQRIAVTGGFQPAVCRECRGLPPEAHPVAPIPGRTSKIKRYYWRELAFREMELFAEWAESHGVSPEQSSGPAAKAARGAAADEALREIRMLHETAPKYTYHETSQADVIRTHSVDVLNLKGTYEPTNEGERARILDAGQAVSPEEFARRHFARLGYESLVLESVPFHVLFGVYMWLLIEDHSDPQVRTVGFGDRRAFDLRQPGSQIWTPLPGDFGTPSYGRRREAAIREHLSPQMHDREELESLFNYWLEPSDRLRQYLWAHREPDIETARRLIHILPPAVICSVLRYLVEDYWHRFCGWPDLLVFRQAEFFFAEVKSSTDKLSEDQKNWIRGNSEVLKLPYKLVKIHRANSRAKSKLHG